LVSGGGGLGEVGVGVDEDCVEEGAGVGGPDAVSGDDA